MAKQLERKHNTRAQLLRAAGQLFDHQGFDDTTIDQIVALADVAKGTFYQHFPTKVAVLLAVMRQRQAEQNSAWVPDEDPRCAVEAYLQAMCQWFQRHANVTEALIWESIKQRDAAHPDTTRGTLSRLLKAAQERGQARSDVDSQILGTYLTGMTVQVILQWASQCPQERLWDRVRPVIQLFWEGAACS